MKHIQTFYRFIALKIFILQNTKKKICRKVIKIDIMVYVV